MGLGSGRRGMKSPPLLIAVLLACVFVLGINYWITSSRCVELQNRVIELEGRMRRAAAERGAVEMKKNEYEDMLGKQKSQIDKIQSLHSSQMKVVQSQCTNEKENLLSNITNKDGLVQTLQVQITNLQKRLDESRLGFIELQESQTKKLAFELAQCGSKLSEAQEQCEEQLRKANVKVTNVVNEDMENILSETEKLKATIKQEMQQQKDDEKKEVKPNLILRPKLTLPVKSWEKQVTPPSQNKEETNDLQVNVDEKKPSAAPQKSKQVDENKEVQDEQAPGKEIDPDHINETEDEDEPKVEDVEETDPNKENEEVERENLINIDGPQEDDKGAKQNEQENDAENPNEYNGDEANEAESEADKQAQLAADKPDIKDDNVQDGKNENAADQEELNGQAADQDVQSEGAVDQEAEDNPVLK